MEPNENIKQTPNIKDQISSLRTFKSDAENLIKEGVSTASIVEAEQRRRQKSGINAPQGQSLSPAYKISIWVSVLFVVLGIGLISTYFFVSKKAEPVTQIKTLPKIITTEFEKTISVDGLDRLKLLSAIEKERAGNYIEARSTAEIKFVKKNAENKSENVGASEWLTLLSVTAPSPFLRSVDDNFLFGLAGYAGNQPFLILKTDSYETAFSGMLTWEKNMTEEIGPIFILKNIVDNQIATSSKTATSTIARPKLTWSDLIIKNKDARVFKDSSGKTVMLYAFVNSETIVVTTNESVFGEIANRLQRGSIVR